MIVRRSPRALVAFAATLSLAGCIGDSLDDEQVDETASEVTIGTPDYELVASLYGDLEFDVASQYARASAIDAFGCSGFLISDNVYVNARHCRATTTGATTITVSWGQYGATDGDFTLATDEARARLENLGVPAQVNPTTAELKTWTCNLVLSPSTRDIDYWLCQPNSISWHESAGDGQVVTLNLEPGHIWGHYKADSGSRPKGRRLYSTHMVQRCGDTQRNLVISTEGNVKDTDYGCVGFGNEDPDHCFEHGLDTIQGSSGAAVVDMTTHHAYAVQQGQWRYWFGTKNKVCSGWPSGQVANVATRFGPEVFDMVAPGPVFASGPTVGWASEFLGGVGGSTHYNECPTGHLAVGVVGTTSAGGYLGNFGLVCMPTGGGMRLDEATVIAHGSFDTGFTVANNTDFNEYHNEVLSTEVAAPHQQNIQLCPPGYFLTGLGGFEGDYVGMLVGMECRHPSTNHAVARLFGQRFGSKFEDMDYTWSSCPAGSYAFALFSRSGWFTDGIRHRCR